MQQPVTLYALKYLRSEGDRGDRLGSFVVMDDHCYYVGEMASLGDALSEER